MISPIYQRACPSCGGDVERKDLINAGHCRKCDGEGGLMAWARSVEDKYEEFERFFLKHQGAPLWGPQRTWSKMVLSGIDVVISAPTGIGKSTLLTALASFLANKGKKVLYVVPSKSLEKQVRDRAPLKNFDVCTMAKLLRNTDTFKGYDVVIFDDVDSAMKSVRSVEAVLEIAGLEEAIPLVNEIMRLIEKGKLEDEEGRRKYRELKTKLTALKEKKRVQLIFASATTGDAKFRVRLMLSVIGLAPAKFPPVIRYIDDVKLRYDNVKDGIVETVSNFVKRGFKGIVFVNEGGPLEEVASVLEKAGIKVSIVKSGKLKGIEELEKGDVQVLVAFATRYGVASRGIDLPGVIRFVVFHEPPYKKVDLEKGLSNPFTLLRLLQKLGENERAVKLAKMISKLNDVELNVLKNALNENKELEGYLGAALREIRNNIEIVKKSLKNKKVVEPGLLIKDNELYVVDHKTYLQASGRCSRLTKNGMTHGVSVVVYSDTDLMKALEEALKHITAFKEEIVYPKGEKKVNVKTSLLIVESPTKAKTISRLLRGGGSIELEGVKAHLGAISLDDEIKFLYIVATKGHLFDLTLDEVGTYGIIMEGEEVKPVYAPINRCKKCRISWASSEPRCPRCGSRAESSLDVISALRKFAFFVDEVIVATDPDEEGEKIAWDLEAMLIPLNKNVKRARYYEVTYRGIREALRNLTTVDEKVVFSQIVRRIDDRLIGFEISSRLWIRLGSKNAGLGRVQGPVLNLVVNRMEEWKKNMGYTVKLELENGDTITLFVKNKEEASRFREIKEVELLSVDSRVEVLKPLPPFTTDTMLEEANSKLRLDASTAMRLAQDLFEMGFITYHRTDSTRVSDAGIAVAKEWIAERFGEEAFVPRRWGEGGAHEAIRPTKPVEADRLKLEMIAYNMDPRAVKLYDLIFKRFMASQMKEAKVVISKVSYRIDDVTVEKELITGVIEEGWTSIIPIEIFEGTLNAGKVKVRNVQMYRSSRKPLPKLYEIIKWMKESGIGRPSTYAKTIENLRRHGFVVTSRKRSFVVATKKGKMAWSYVKEIMPELLDVNYTRRLEGIMDEAKHNLPVALHTILEGFRALASAET